MNSPATRVLHSHKIVVYDSEAFKVVALSKIMKKFSGTEKDTIFELQNALLNEGYYTFISMSPQDKNLPSYSPIKLQKIIATEAKQRKQVHKEAIKNSKIGMYNQTVFVEIFIPTESGIPVSKCYAEIYTMEDQVDYGTYFTKDVKKIEKITRKIVNGYVTKNHSFSFRKKNS